MKKTISLLISVSIMLASVVSFAENTDEMQDVLLKVKSRIGDTDRYEEFSSGKYTDDDNAVYYFEWNSGYNSYLHISATANGVITEYSSYDTKPNEYPLSINKPTQEEALAVAKSEFARLNPDVADEYVITSQSDFEDIHNDGYGFDLSRYKNGVKVSKDHGNISLNSDLSLSGFDMAYTDVEFESLDDVISKEEAVSAFNEKIGLKPYYILDTNDGKDEIKIVYSTPSDEKYINAKTGDVFENINYNSYDNMTDSVSSIGKGDGFSEAEQNNIDNIEGLLAQDEAEKSIKNSKAFEIENQYSLQVVNLLQSSDGDYIYIFNYSDTEYNMIYATVDAKTGEVLNYSNTKYSNDKKEADKSKIDKSANDVLSELAPEKSKEYKLDISDDYYRSYVRYINDIPFYNDRIAVRFNDDYSLGYYEIDYSDYDFPKPDGIISSGEAFDKIVDLVGYDIVYMSNGEKFILVYTNNDYILIDAFTADCISNNNESRTVPKYTDISGHYAEKQINALAKYGIFFDGTEFRPNDVITKKDFAALLGVVFDYDSNDILRDNGDKTYAYERYFGTEEISDEELTRLSAAKLMIKAIGYEKCADLTPIYKELYSDVTDGIGYVNILTGMGVVSGDENGCFNPNVPITRAQAIMMIYNYLNK